MDLVHGLTGKPLSADAWVHVLSTPTEEVIKTERQAYEAAVKIGPKISPGTDVDLDMRILLVDGDDVISDTGNDGFVAACEKYKKWLDSIER